MKQKEKNIRSTDGMVRFFFFFFKKKKKEEGDEMSRRREEEEELKKMVLGNCVKEVKHNNVKR